jgi:hypothetical protein
MPLTLSWPPIHIEWNLQALGTLSYVIDTQTSLSD